MMQYGIDISALGLPSPSTPPVPPPRPPRTNGDGGEEPEEKKPTFEVIPHVKKTTVPLNFLRRQLEEFMDR